MVVGGAVGVELVGASAVVPLGLVVGLPDAGEWVLDSCWVVPLERVFGAVWAVPLELLTVPLLPLGPVFTPVPALWVAPAETLWPLARVLTLPAPVP